MLIWGYRHTESSVEYIMTLSKFLYVHTITAVLIRLIRFASVDVTPCMRSLAFLYFLQAYFNSREEYSI